MKKTRKKKLLSYAGSIVVAGVIAGLVTIQEGFSLGGDWVSNFRYLSDGCFMAGMIFTVLGLLTWVFTTGFFDIFAYGFKSLTTLASPQEKSKDHVQFHEYKTEKEAKRPKAKTTILFTGVGYVLISLLFLHLYYNF